ncbi:MAG: hypothetical protein CVU24_11305 [Betaproteobacteria bacterium HGW-Betaproteobacteria-18]|nr:MAG: hypothetical protein CVU24_11305 [Betaproteobacteria bacterium HGW-Betaproteobacteria-18]
MKKTAVQMTQGLLLVGVLLLAGCASPRPAETRQVYDFGPAPLPASATGPQASLTAVVLFDPQVSPALEGNAVLYRLGYADAQQLKPYAVTRWSMPPAQLIGQRLRQQIGSQRAVVAPGELMVASAPGQIPVPKTLAQAAPLLVPSAVAPLLHLRLVLEEFSQVFDSPTSSHGLLRLRATLTQRTSGSETLLAQRSFVAQQPAPTPDAVGAVRALTAASDQVVAQIEAWLTLWGRL